MPTHPPLSFDTEIVFFLECGRRREGRRERKKIRFRSLRITLLCWLCAAGRRRRKEWRKAVHRHQRGAQQSLRNTPIRPRKKYLMLHLVFFYSQILPPVFNSLWLVMPRCSSRIRRIQWHSRQILGVGVGAPLSPSCEAASFLWVLSQMDKKKQL